MIRNAKPKPKHRKRRRFQFYWAAGLADLNDQFTAVNAQLEQGVDEASAFSRLFFAAFCFLFCTFTAAAQEKITYLDHVLPLIENNCGKCHNPDKKKGDLDLTTYSGVMKGSGSGQVVVSGNPDDTLPTDDALYD